MKIIFTIIVAALLCSCANLYTSIVTVTEVRDTTMKELAGLYARGRISPETDARIGAADQQFREAATVCRAALVSYKLGTSTNEPVQQLQNVKIAVSGLIEIARPFVFEAITKQRYSDLEKATKL